MKLDHPIYRSNQFSWIKNKGVAFLTDLCGRGEPHSAIYDDACDVGFTVSSMKTGMKITFVYTGTTKSDPVELLYSSIDRNGKTGTYKIRILNT